MANTGFISIAPQLAAMRVVVDDIHDTDLPGVATIVTQTGLGVIDIHDTDLPAVQTVVDDIRAVDVPAIQVDVGALNDVSIEDIEGARFIASDDLVHSNDAEATSYDAAYTKYREIVCAYTGVYRVKFELKTQLAADPAWARIYLNGGVHGTEQQTPNDTYTEFSEDLSFTKGDLLQLYLKQTTAGNATNTRNLRIYGIIGTDFINNM